jgi:4-alpha-glucanotransferase
MSKKPFGVSVCRECGFCNSLLERNFLIAHTFPTCTKKNCVAYTGSHDNNTVLGWYKNEIGDGTKQWLHQYLKRMVPENEVHWEMIRIAMMSVANTVII